MSVQQQLSYTFRFTSLFSPGTINSLRLYRRIFSLSEGRESNVLSESKILVKQSYLILVWFFYISSGISMSYGSDTPAFKDFNPPAFFIYPKKRSFFTILKAPMAHKTFSQEQFKFQYYTYSITITPPPLQAETGARFPRESIIFFLNFFRGLQFLSGTNMLLLTTFSTSFFIIDSSFFSFHSFSR